MSVPKEMWTEDDEHLLRQVVYSGGAEAAYGAFPDRSAVSVHSKMQRMGLLAPRAGGWTENEDNVLFNDYAELGAAGLAASGRLPGRTCESIRHRARFLGIRFESFVPAAPRREEVGSGRRWTPREDRFARAVMERMAESPLRKYLLRAANLLDVSEGELAARMLELMQGDYGCF